MSAYFRQSGQICHLGNSALEATLDLSSGVPYLSELTNKISGNRFAFRQTRDLVLRFSAARHRIELFEWAFRPGSAEASEADDEAGYRQGWQAPDFDASDWLVVSALNEYPVGAVGYTTVVYPGFGWYRQSFGLPESARGQAVSFVLGGSDDQDWLDYWVYLNGHLIGHQSPGRERWHAVPRYTLRPDEPAYATLRFDAPNVLAVQARGLDRRSPRMVESSLERFSIGTPLFEQFVAVGEPYRDVEAFRLISVETTERDRLTVVDLSFSDNADVGLEVRYWLDGDEPVLYKQARVRNRGVDSQVLLDVDLLRLSGTAPTSEGGWGEVCTLGEEVFCGVAHPSGSSLGQRGEIRLQLSPGRTLRPGEVYESKTAILGVGPAGEGQRSFIRHLERHGRRRPEFLALYSPYGIYDYAGAHQPTPVTEELVLTNLEQMKRLRDRGAHFDYYVIDCGWNNPSGDFKDFNPDNFPRGPGRVVEEVRNLGMKLGLWVSPSHGPAAFRPETAIPGLQACGTLPPRPDQETDRPRGALCLAAEPYRTMLREGLRHHVRENSVRCFKLDGGRLFCNNPAHGHLPGKYSVESLADALIDTIARVREVSPDLMIVWYWGFRSPWWLLHGDTLYEHGVHIEAATPSDTPSPILRQSVTVALDQGADYAWDRVPLYAQDSLGIWISDTRWGNWMKQEGWRDAWIMDLARGSLLAQLWGDISLFDDEDVDFLARTLDFARRSATFSTRTRRILGSPWTGEPYGYAQLDGKRGWLAIHNPSFAQRAVAIRLGQEAGPLDADRHARFVVRCLHPLGPVPTLTGRSEWELDDVLTLTLGPFAVVLLEVKPVTSADATAFPTVSTIGERSLKLAGSLAERSREPLIWPRDEADPTKLFFARRAINGRAQYVDTETTFRASLVGADDRDRQLETRQVTGRLALPVIRAASTLIVVVQLSRDGIFWHHHALFDLISVRPSVDGKDLPTRTTPNRWHEQAGGWSWITFQAPIGPTTRPVSVDLEGRLCLPTTVDAQFEAWLIVQEG